MSVVVTEPVTSGLVLLKTSLGDILIELWPREAPKAVRNFVQLCLEGYYDGLPFHRVVPGFIAQTGDDSGTGGGGESIYDEGEFEDEFTQRLRFTRRGLVAMANQGRKNSNLSQFFFTLDRADELNNRNTIFGRVAAGDTLFNVLKLNEIELEPGTDRPVYPPTIKSVEVRDNPFEDIVPRITAKERKEQNRAKKEMKIERAKQREQSKRKGTKNKSLLSFGAEPEEPVDDTLAKTKFKSAHDALDDERLSKKVLDDRGTSATLPPGMEGPAKRKREDDSKKSDDSRRSKTAAPVAPVASTSSLERAREAKKAEPNAADKRREEIEKVQQDLKKMSRSKDSDDEDSGKKAKKVKRTGPSLLQLERAKYASAASSGKQKKGDDSDVLGMLDGFRSKLFEAKPSTSPEKEKEKSAQEAALGIDLDGDSGDEGWMSHSLIFRKDVTLDQHTVDEYDLVDPLAKNTESLAEIKQKADSRRRQYPGERDDAGRGGGSRGGRGGGGSGSRGGYERNEGRDRGSHSDRRRGPSGSEGRGDNWGSSKDRPEVQGNWKADRVSTTDLA